MLYLETTELDFYQDPASEEPPADFFDYVFEDVHLRAIVEEIELGDAFSSDPPYTVSVLMGN